MEDYAGQRERMVQRQVAARGIRDPAVLAAMRAVPREAFVGAGVREFAYEDSPLPIEAGQTISQPYIVALMIEAAQVGPSDRVLEIGAGSGYAAAVLGRIARQVNAIERHSELSDLARVRIHRLGYDNVRIRTGDGSGGWPEAAPFDAILVAAGAPRVPAALREQLAIGGRLVLPVGETGRRQRLVKIVRTAGDAWQEEDLGDVRFVPLVGEHGWRDDAPVSDRAVARMLQDMLDRQLEYSRDDADQFLDASQNARLVRNAEAYYRAMYYGAAESWNLRDTHMFETLAQLLAAGGPDARAVVWAHNSHIGDARHTDMGQVRGELNLGQLCRQAWNSDAVLLGFGTHAGMVAAATDWDAPLQVMEIAPSMAGSVERLFHDSGKDSGFIDLREGRHSEARDVLSPSRLERYIGVVYRPGTERWSHYAASELARQYDGWIWFDTTSAVSALADGHGRGVPGTWPFGVQGPG